MFEPVEPGPEISDEKFDKLEPKLRAVEGVDKRWSRVKIIETISDRLADEL